MSVRSLVGVLICSAALGALPAVAEVQVNTMYVSKILELSNKDCGTVLGAAQQNDRSIVVDCQLRDKRNEVSYRITGVDTGKPQVAVLGTKVSFK